ncbi:MAG: hypothetical protein DDT32_00716 [Syntrophomonadaceae bacterium]|nr:hypothetical protein [Bacillota bacterium]
MTLRIPKDGKCKNSASKRITPIEAQTGGVKLRGVIPLLSINNNQNREQDNDSL